MTKQKPIPDEIMREAESIAKDIPSRVTDINRGFAANVIARALMARDERAAKIVKTIWGRKEIAAAILTYGDN